MIKKSNYLTASSIILVIFFTTCQQDPDSPPDDPIECPDGYHICGSDSTDCCLDTTSHNFVWEIDTLGSYGSFLNDVAIVDEDDIWVVGNIETDSGEYNAAHWNGNEWELMGFHSNTADLYSIKYFTENDIWVTSHCFPLHWDGIEWTLYHLNDLGMPGVCVGEAIWGTSSSNIYFAGLNGGVVHYDGTEFTEMESGTDVDLKNITSNDSPVFTIGYDYTNNPNISLELKNDEWIPFYESAGYYGDPNNPEDYGKPYGIDVVGDTVYLATSGSFGPSNLVKYNYKTGTMTADSVNYLYSLLFVVRGLIVNNTNDIFILDKVGQIVHYNGARYNMWRSAYANLIAHDFIYGGSDYKDGLLVLAGYNLFFNYAIVAKGYRY